MRVTDRLRSSTESGTFPRLDVVLSTEVDAIIVIDEAGIVESANPATERIFGYAPEEIVGQNVKVLMPEPYRSEHDGYLAHLLNTGERKIIGIGREVRGRRKDGTVFFMDLSVSEMLIGSNRMFTGIVRDLSKEKRVQGSLRLMSKVFMDAADPILVEDLSGRVTELNEEAERAYGWTRDELVGKPIKTIVPPEHHGQTDELRERCRSGESVRSVEGLRWTKAGEVVPVLLTLSLLTDDAGEALGIATISKNIGELKRAQEKLIEQESLAKLGEMSAIVAHEVKNPLAGIIGASRMLGRRLPEGSEEREIADALLSRAEDLNAGVKDILAYSRPRTPEKSSVPVCILLDDLITLVSSDPEFEGVEVEHQTTSVRCHLLIPEGTIATTEGRCRRAPAMLLLQSACRFCQKVSGSLAPGRYALPPASCRTIEPSRQGPSTASSDGCRQHGLLHIFESLQRLTCGFVNPSMEFMLSRVFTARARADELRCLAHVCLLLFHNPGKGRYDRVHAHAKVTQGASGKEALIGHARTIVQGWRRFLKNMEEVLHYACAMRRYQAKELICFEQPFNVERKPSPVPSRVCQPRRRSWVVVVR